MRRVSMVVHFLLLLAVTGYAPLLADRMKRVIVLDFKNLDKNPDYQYLESSITDAVKTDLKAKFVFKEMPVEEWQKLAADNLFSWPDENYTKGFATNLGKAGRQDVVIGGSFQAAASRTKGKRGTFRERKPTGDKGCR